MAQTSAIEWTDATWNPVTGCDRVSPGCAHCYALELAPRLRRFAEARGHGKWLDVRDGGKTSGPAFGVTLHPAELELPLRWRRPRMVFVNSMSDLFHEEVPDSFIDAVFETMALAPKHTFQVLTKRPERMRDYMRSRAAVYGVADPDVEALPNVWLGVTIENRRFVGRADALRETPAAVRFISAEPLLGPLVGVAGRHDGATPRECARCGKYYRQQHILAGIDWLIVGGESGPGHRPMRAEWVRDLRDACVLACSCSRIGGGGPDHVHRPAFFFKQWGGATSKSGGRELDGRTWDEMPIARQAVSA